MQRNSIKTPAILSLMAVAAHATVNAQPYDVSWYTVDGGGELFSVGGSYELSGTIGQPDASGPLTGGTYELAGGFWAGATVSAPLPGDCDGDGDVDLDDHGALLACLSGPGGGLGAGCGCFDSDGDADVDLLDFGWFQRAFGDF